VSKKKSWLQFKSIRTKFIGWFLLVALIPLITVTLVVENLNSKVLLEQEKNSMHSLVLSKAQATDEWFNSQMAELELVAETDILKSMNKESIVPFLSIVNERSDVFETVFTTDVKGTVIAHTTEKSIGSDYSERGYVQAAVKGESNFSEVLTSKATGNRIVVVATPVKDDNGTVIGVLAGSANFEVLVDTFLSNGADSMENVENIELSTLITLVDAQERLQVSPEEELNGVPINESDLGEALSSALKKSLSETGISSFERFNEEFLIAYAPIESVGYGLSLNMPESLVLADSKSIQKTAILIIVLTTILIVILAFFIVNKMTRPILSVANGMTIVASGDLTVDRVSVKANDEIGDLADSFNEMVTNIKKVIETVATTAEQVAASSEELTASAEETKRATEQITGSIQSVASGAELQATSTEDAGRVITDISSKITHISSNIQVTNNMTEETVVAATNGNEIIERSINQMKTIDETTDAASRTINGLGEKSSQIETIVSVIKAIAEQTNLLALNAAIEAARAGEHGKGFAVVADEVRKLAEQSGQASGQISSLIKDIQVEINASISAMKKGKLAVNDGATFVGQAGQAFETISNAITRVSEQMKDVSITITQIRAGSEEMVSSIKTITHISEEASNNTHEVASASEQQHASMEEITTAAHTLSKMAEELQETTRMFRL
jgi:methyl-accepting chemotaxis protein